MDLNGLIREVQGTHIEAALLAARGHRELAEGTLSDEAAYSAKKWLHSRGLATEENMAGQYDLTYDGQQLADALQKSRRSGEGRLELVTRALVEMILAGGSAHGVTVVDGEEVAAHERELALTRLEKWKCVDAVHAAQQRFVRVDAAPGLYEAHGVVGTLKEHYEGRGYVDQRVTNTTNVSDSHVGGIQTGGSGNTMHVTQTISELERTGVTAKLDQVLALLADVDGAEDLRAAVEEIREVALLPEATKPSIKQKVVEGLEVAGNLASVTQASPVMAQGAMMLAQLLGIVG